MPTQSQLYTPVIVRQELDDEHFYMVDGKYHPSVTKVLHETLPMPIGLRKWLGDVGNEKASEKLETAAARGSAIHEMCERLLLGGEVKTYEELTTNGDRKIVAAFINWIAAVRPLIPLGNSIRSQWSETPTIEFTVASQLGFAGTLDIFCYIKNEPYILDIKTSSGIYDEHMLQITAYQQAWYEMTGIKPKRGIIHLNSRTKAGISFYDDKDIQIAGKPVDIEAFKKVWDMFLVLNGGEIPEPPTVAVYPEVLTLVKKND